MSEGPQKLTEDDHPTPYHHGRLKEAAIAGALAVIEADGHEALSLRKLAATLGVTHKALYRHFANRDELMVETLATGFEQLVAALRPAGDSKEAFCRAYIEFALSNRGLYTAMMALEGRKETPSLRAPINNLIALARLAIGNDRAVKRTWAILHGGLSLHHTGTLEARTDGEVITFLLDLCQDG